MRILGIVTLILAAVFGAWATPSVKLSYCTEIEDGYGDSGGSITPWVAFGPEKTDMYVGGQITTVRIGLNSKANNVTIYLKHKPEDNEPFFSQKAGTLVAGWHEITLDTPYTIVEGEPVAIGYKATFTKAKGAGFSSNFVKEASRAYYNTKGNWIDIKGAFCIEAYVEGDNLIKNEVGLLSVTDGVKGFHDDMTPIYATVINLGSNEVETFTLSFSVDGEDATDVDFEENLEPGDKATVEILIPEAGIGVHEVTVTVKSVNGEPDSYQDNNTLSCKITEPDPSFMRRVVAEEGTGTWCGWCPRGIVGFEMMEEKYPEQFIGMAVHGNDSFEVPEYALSLSKMPTFPNSFINRHIVGDPYTEIESNYQKEINEPCQIGYEMIASIDGNTVTTISKLRVAEERAASSLTMAFTILEDNLFDYQMNSYSGSSEEMGGWELLGNRVGYYYKDIVRGIFPSYSGEMMLEGMLSPGEEYEYTYIFELPTVIKDKTQLHIVGQVFDRSNGFILNASKIKPEVYENPDANVDEIEIDNYSLVNSEIFSLDGIPVSIDTISIPGIYIIRNYYSDGSIRTKKIVKK